MNGYVSYSSLCILNDFSSGILKLFGGDFYQVIKLRNIYFSLTDRNCDNVIFNSFTSTFVVFVISSLSFTTGVTSPVT